MFARENFSILFGLRQLKQVLLHLGNSFHVVTSKHHGNKVPDNKNVVNIKVEYAQNMCGKLKPTGPA
jgi:hypothetical protein